MYGIPFCGIGWLIAKREIILSRAVAWSGFVICTAIRIFEFALPYVSAGSWQGNAFSVAFIPQSVMFFFMAYHCKGAPAYSRRLRQLSTFIYLAHWPLLYNIVDPVLLLLGVDIYTTAAVPLKAFLTLAVCVCMNWGIKKVDNKYIQFLIGS